MLKRKSNFILFGLLSIPAICANAAGMANLESDRIATSVGLGGTSTPLIVSWGDGNGIDNFVVSLLHDDPSSLSPDQVISMLVEADRRFYTPEGATSTALAFDQGGDGVFDDEAYTEFDHLCADNDEGRWVLSAISDNEAGALMLHYQKYAEPSGFNPEYIFYLPDAKEIGAWLHDDVMVERTDASPLVPVYMNCGAGNTVANITTTLTTDDRTYISTFNAADTKKIIYGYGYMKLKFATYSKDKDTGEYYPVDHYCGTANPKLQLRYKKAGATVATAATTRQFALTVTPPAPLAGLTLTPAVDPAPVTEKLQLHLAYAPAGGEFAGGLDFVAENLDTSNSSNTVLSMMADMNDPTLINVSFSKTNVGRVRINATSRAYPEISASTEFDVYASNLVSSISMPDDELAGITLDAYTDEEFAYNMHIIHPVVEPADADITHLILHTSLDDAEDGPIATLYYQKADKGWELQSRPFGTRCAFDATTEEKIAANKANYALLDAFQEPVSCTAWLEAADGSGVRTDEFEITLQPRDRNVPDDNYQDGFFWLNEEWFGHTNGSINYITADDEIKYRVFEAQNSGEFFGCTSQYGMIFGDRLYVMSKQQLDNGDRYRAGSGGRLVVADAKTLKKIVAFDEIGTTAGTGATGPNGSTMAGDGRACVGVRPDKVYLGHHKGIRVLNIDLDKAASDDPETAASAFTLGNEIVVNDNNGSGLYNGQVGDMVATQNFVFAVSQDRGLLVIDPEKDEIIKLLGTVYISTDSKGNEKISYSVQGVTQTADGHVWMTENDTRDKNNVITRFVEIDPLTAEIINTYTLPEGAGTVNTGWGAWRSANFFAGKKKNVIYWGNVGSGYNDQILGAGTGYIFRWEPGKELPTEAFFNLGKRPGMNETTFQQPYATMGYDEVRDRVVMATTHGASYNYRHEWIHFIDGTTGEELSWQKLAPYFWFPAMPIMPDKYDPELSLGAINIESVDRNLEIDLSEYLSDADNIDANIRVELADADEDAEVSTYLANYTLDGRQLYVNPKAQGSEPLNFVIESNGKRIMASIPVSVGTTGVDLTLGNAAGKIFTSGQDIILEGYAGFDFSISDMQGCVVGSYHAENVKETIATGLPGGIYILSGVKGNDRCIRKIIIR